jgi:hypothetical protein
MLVEKSPQQQYRQAGQGARAQRKRFCFPSFSLTKNNTRLQEPQIQRFDFQNDEPRSKDRYSCFSDPFYSLRVLCGRK